MRPTTRQQQNVAWLTGGLIFAGLIAAWWVLRPPTINPVTLCASEPVTSTVVVLDRTDLSAVQTTDEIRRRIQKHVETMAAGDRLSVFTVDDLSPTSLIPQFDKCKPDTEYNELVQDVNAAKKRDKIRFFDPLERVLAAEHASAKQSPIAEALIDLSRSSYLRAKANNQLLIFSDMIQHKPPATMLACTNSEEFVDTFKRGRVGGTQRPAFANLTVQLHVIPRSGLAAAGDSCRTYFWNWFFGDAVFTGTTPPSALIWDQLPGPVWSAPRGRP